MEQASTPKAFVFDLDNTLFGHHHSLRCAISAVQSKFPELAKKTSDELITKYDTALQSVHDAYLRGEITYEQADEKILKGLCSNVGLAERILRESTNFEPYTSEHTRKPAAQPPATSRPY